MYLVRGPLQESDLKLAAVHGCRYMIVVIMFYQGVVTPWFY